MQALLNKRGETIGWFVNKAVISVQPPHTVVGVVLGDVLYTAGPAPVGKFIDNFLYDTAGKRLAKLLDMTADATVSISLSKEEIDDAKWKILPHIHEFTLNWIATTHEWAATHWQLEPVQTLTAI
ncbi:MAG: hypothetical protein MUF62_01090 [Chitinophagaceae bacterium]|jgi:hypothetical protein|nr:hypothetical protein [Chitinophagaceae bacterium]